MGVGALYKANLVEWMSTQTYQAVSGGGTQLIRSLLKDSVDIATAVKDLLNNPKSNILDLDKLVTTCQQNSSFPITEGFEDPTLANSLIPWVDKDLGGVSREEWKGMVETNKILGIGSDSGTTPIPVDGFCVRVATMRCHSQALLFKLKKDVPIEDIEAILAADHEWLRLVPNTREATIRQLTPVAVTGTLSIAVGRIRKMAMGNRYLGAFTIGDQLLWGAAEPLRRMLRILLEY
jgi:aspartate-semialdehyde dehydrogenase